MHIAMKGFVVLAALLMFGCATSYQPSGFAGGYSDARLRDDMFSVSFSGNAWTGGTYAADMALLRAAEVAQDNGFRYFSIVQSSDKSTLGSYTDPVRVNVTNYPSIGSGYTSVSATGGQTTVYSKPSTRMVIKGHKERTEHSFSANSVISSTRFSYGMPGQ